jgi:hypothetical protein
MKLAESLPGDRFLDRDLDVWTRLHGGAVVFCHASREIVAWSESELADADEEFGPFARTESGARLLAGDFA